MPNKFYVSGEQRATKVGDLFATIAPRYDLINDLQSFGLHRWWKRRLVKLAEIRPGDRALDVCCGTGDITFALARAGAETIGLDFSASMLAVAARRQPPVADAVGHEPDHLNPQFLQGDAMALPFPDRHFAVVTVGYGLRNLASWQRGLVEMFRVTQPGGRVLVLDFAKPDNPLWRWLFFSYLRLVVPWFGRLLCGDADTHRYILESLEHYPAQRGVEAEMQTLGGAQVRTLNLLGGLMSINRCVKA